MIDNSSLSVQAEINRIETKETAHQLSGMDNLGLDMMHNPGSRNCAIFVYYVNSSELHLWSVALLSQYSDPAPEAITLH